MPNLKLFASRTDEPLGFTSYQYYFTPELNQRFHLICHLIQNSEQLLLILAETGCGKTALLNQLKKTTEKEYQQWWIYTLTSSPALSPEAFISAILAAFNVRQDGKPLHVLQDSLRNHITATRYNEQLPVLFVDDAHKLPLATLKYIIELAMQGEPLTRMRVILFCEPQITSILATPEFEIVQKNMTHTLDIPPFSGAQVRDYLLFRLQNSKYSTIHPFSNDIIKKIYRESEGIPGEINRYAQQVLRRFAEQRHDYPLTPSLSYSKLLRGLAIVLVLLGIALWVWKSPNSPKESPSESSSPSLYDQLPTTQRAHDTEVTVPSATTPTLTDVQAGVAASIDSMQNQIEVKREDWLRRQNPNAYTLQILGVHDSLTIEQFIAQHNRHKFAMFKTTFHQKDWYVLLYGIYPNHNQALIALETLPAELRQNTQPWIRTLASVQRRINQHTP